MCWINRKDIYPELEIRAQDKAQWEYEETVGHDIDMIGYTPSGAPSQK